MKRGLLLLLLAAGYGTAAAGAELGRLFFTPAQRAALDSARKQNVRTELGNDNPQETAPLPQNITINGLIRRSDGKTTVWVNNRAVTEQQPNGVNVVPYKNDNRVKLTTPDSGHSVDLKVGQTLELNSGTVQEGSAPSTAASGQNTAPVSGTNSPQAAQQAAPPAPPGPKESNRAPQSKSSAAAEQDEPNNGQPGDNNSVSK